jgi:nucleoside-diphosphate-sugar epimerase
VSLFDRSALAEVFAGHDAVVNLASAIPSMTRFTRARAWEANDRIRREGSAAVVDAALAAGVERVVQESVSMIYPDQGERWIDEDLPVDHFPLAAGNVAAEASAQRFSAAGGQATVLRFGLFYGPGPVFTEQLLALAGRHVALVTGPPESYVSSIHLADAATAVVAALRAPAGTYNVVDDQPLTKRELGAALGGAAGTAIWVRMPGRAAVVMGHRLTSLTRSLRVSNRRLRAAGDWAPSYPSAREGWLATARSPLRTTKR